MMIFDPEQLHQALREHITAKLPRATVSVHDRGYNNAVVVKITSNGREASVYIDPRDLMTAQTGLDKAIKQLTPKKPRPGAARRHLGCPFSRTKMLQPL